MRPPPADSHRSVPSPPAGAHVLAARREAEVAALGRGELPPLDGTTRFLPRALLGLERRLGEESRTGPVRSG